MTGDSDDPNSTHVTLGDVFDGLELSLDRAFLTYHPAWHSEGFLTFGKFSHPFVQNPVYGELLWDADVQPEGVAVGGSLPELGPFASPRVVLGGYTVLERSGGRDAWVLVAQASGSVRLGESLRADVAAGYYHFTDPTPGGATGVLADNAGNATVDLDMNGMPDEFVSEFGVLNPIVTLREDGWSVPLALVAEYSKNLRAEIPEDAAWALGFSAGSTAQEGDWRVYYQWQVVERDAVFSAFAQDDFLFQTNHRSHVAGVNYQLSGKVGLHLWTLISSPEDAGGDDDWRVRLDLNVKL